MIWVIVLLLVGAAVFEAVLYGSYRKMRRPLFTKLCSALLLSVCLVILFLTVFSRNSGARTGVRLIPFWSYRKALVGLKKGRYYFFKQIVLNIILFIPMGIILPYLTEKAGIKKYLVFFFAGLAFSLFIEIMQYVLKLGVFDMDDLIGNSLGCMLGVLISARCKKRIQTCLNTDLEV